MKKILLSLSVIAALVISQSASADGRFWGGYSSWGSGHYYRSYNPYPYGYGYRRGGPYFGVSYGSYYPRHRYRHRHWDSGSFVGGLVLGSILSPRHNHRRYETVTYRRPVRTTREVVYVNKSNSTAAPVASGRRLLKDLEGNCFERNIDEAGNEVRVQLEDSECNF